MSAQDNLSPQQFYHATGAWRNESIEREGFRASDEGESGPGVYAARTMGEAAETKTGFPGKVSVYHLEADVHSPLDRTTPEGEDEYTNMRQTVGYGKPDKWSEELGRRGYDYIDRGSREVALPASKVRIVGRTDL